MLKALRVFSLEQNQPLGTLLNLSQSAALLIALTFMVISVNSKGKTRGQSIANGAET